MTDTTDPRGARSAFSLAELLLVLSILAAALAVALPRVAAVLDAIAVRGAAETARAVFDRARSDAIAGGGELVTVDAAAGTLVAAPATGGRADTVAVAREFGVALSVAGAPSAVVRYSALGLAAVGSRTITFRRGAATAGVTISSYGRVRAW